MHVFSDPESVNSHMARSSSVQRAVDCFLGIPAVALLRLIRRKKTLPQSFRSVGIICPTAIGDLILASGIIRRIHENFPDCEIHLFHGKSNSGAVTLLPSFVVSNECDFTKVLNVIRCIRRRKLDCVIDVTPWPRLTAICAGLANAPTVGFKTKGQFRHGLFDVVIDHSQSRHEVDNFSAIADVFGKGHVYKVLMRDYHREYNFKECLENVVLCHPCAGGTRAEAKSWPIEYWTELCRRLLSLGLKVVFTGTKADELVVEKILDAVKRDEQEAFSLCGKMSLEEMMGALAKCRLFVTVDTGVMHLADALGVPMVALFGPTSLMRWGPRSNNALVVQSLHRGSGYISLGFEKSIYENQVMAAIPVEQVFSEIRNLLCSTGPAVQ